MTPLHMSKNGLDAVIIQRPDGYWILPGGKAYLLKSEAMSQARAMFRAAGWQHKRAMTDNPYYGD